MELENNNKATLWTLREKDKWRDANKRRFSTSNNISPIREEYGGGVAPGTPAREVWGGRDWRRVGVHVVPFSPAPVDKLDGDGDQIAHLFF